jgi:hypothetical protein
VRRRMGFNTDYVARLTQSVSQLALKPGKEKIKKNPHDPKVTHEHENDLSQGGIFIP